MSLRKIQVLLILVFASIAWAGEATRYSTLVERARERLERHDTEAALQYANDAIRKDPSQWKAYVVAAGAYVSQGRSDKAREVADAGLRAVPRERRDTLGKLLAAIIAHGPGSPPDRLPAGR